MAYVKSVCDRWNHVNAVYYDHTGTKGMDEQIETAGFPRIKGVDFTKPLKHGMATTLKQLMMTPRESDKNQPPQEARRKFELPYRPRRTGRPKRGAVGTITRKRSLHLQPPRRLTRRPLLGTMPSHPRHHRNTSTRKRRSHATTLTLNATPKFATRASSIPIQLWPAKEQLSLIVLNTRLLPSCFNVF